MKGINPCNLVATIKQGRASTFLLLLLLLLPSFNLMAGEALSWVPSNELSGKVATAPEDSDFQAVTGKA